MTTSVGCGRASGTNCEAKAFEIIDLTQDSDSEASMDVEEYGCEDDDIVDITDIELAKTRREQILNGINFAKLGKRFYNIQDYNLAAQYFKNAIEADGSNFEYFYYKSMSLYNLLELRTACNDAKTAVRLALGKDKFKCLMWLLQIKTEMGELKYCEDIIENVKQYPHSEEEFKKAEADITILGYYLTSLESAHDSEKIIQLLSKVLEVAPKSVKLLLMQAKTYIDIEKYWDARVTCIHLQGVFPNRNSPINMGMSNLLRFNDNPFPISGAKVLHEDARLFRKALKYDNHNAQAMYLQSHCYYHTGEINKAKKSARDALERKPDTETYVSWFEGLDCLEKELQKATDSKETSKFSTVKDFNQAKRSYERCLEIASSPVMLNKKLAGEICFNMAEIGKMEGNNNEAFEWCDKALEFREEYVEAFVLKGDVEMLEYLFKDAQENYKRALAMAPGNSKIKQKLDRASKGADFPDYYRIMEIEKTDSYDAVKLAYKKFLLKFHPDKNAGASQAQLDLNKRRLEKVKEAYDILINKSLRENYDSCRRRDIADGGNRKLSTLFC